MRLVLILSLACAACANIAEKDPEAKPLKTESEEARQARQRLQENIALALAETRDAEDRQALEDLKRALEKGEAIALAETQERSFGPLGYAANRKLEEPDPSEDFIPVPNRWFVGFPEWQRHEGPLGAAPPGFIPEAIREGVLAYLKLRDGPRPR